eukprot:c18834_g1_i3 orf=192-1445(-)
MEACNLISSHVVKNKSVDAQRIVMQDHDIRRRDQDKHFLRDRGVFGRLPIERSGSHALRQQCKVNLKVLVLMLILPAFMVGIIVSEWQKISYFLRPIWDRPPKPFQYLIHYYAENTSLSQLCLLHGWKLRETPRRVFDAIIFNNELDLLEIRWQELLPHVTRFIVLESNSTFTGLSKPLLFSLNRERFKFAEPNIVYSMIPGRKLEKGENPFVLEALHRSAMDKVLLQAGVQRGDLIIMSDADEIPSAHTVNLLRWCDNIPNVFHLQMNYYIYSFEFLVDKSTWRPSIHLYQPSITSYGHSRQADIILADSGWHCSFCFRHLKDFVFKMTSYSHADRIKSSRFLDPNRIQRIICTGGDLFDMLPEEYTFREIIGKMGGAPLSSSAVHLPAFLLRNSSQFEFLLPGNCLRQSDYGEEA